jgi:chemotaxis protein histidine kinase CheA
MEKQIIISKTEFDEMEQELNALRKIVDNNTITAIFRYNYPNNKPYKNYGSYRVPIGTSIEYILDANEHIIIEDLTEEVDNLRVINTELQEELTRVYENFSNHRLEQGNWKFLPWYKRLFIR